MTPTAEQLERLQRNETLPEEYFDFILQSGLPLFCLWRAAHHHLTLGRPLGDTRHALEHLMS